MYWTAMTLAPIEQYSEFHLGNILVIPQHNQLQLEDSCVQVQPKVMAVLCYLAEHRERVISSDELIEKVWEGRVVTSGSVQKSINALRKALASLDGDASYIEFFSKRGYQINLNIEVSLLAAQTPEQSPSPVQARPKKPWPWLFASALVTALILTTAVLNLDQNAESISNSSNTSNSPNWAISWEPPDNFLSEFGQLADFKKGSKLPTPHPGGQRLAYVETNLETHVENSETQTQKGVNTINRLMLKNQSEAPWALATSKGEWIDIAWSPSGRNLVAVELWIEEDAPEQSSFYLPPVYFYNFHIFTLDFKGQNIIEKNRLSQWQGSVKSVSWWDENILEFVASQGQQQHTDRYRYHVPEQKLSQLPALPDFQVLISKTQNKHSALLGIKKGETQIKILGPEQRGLAEFITRNDSRLMWLPDTQGILTFDTDTQTTKLYFLNGESQTINPPSELSSRIKNLAVADNILWAELETQEHQLAWLSKGKNINTQNGIKKWRTASLAADGKSLMSLSHETEKTLFTFIQNETTKTFEADFPAINPEFIWTSKLNQFFLIDDNKLWRIDKEEEKLDWVSDIPLGFSALLLEPELNRLWMMEHSTVARNIWLYDLSTRQNKQFTYGSLGSALADAETIYFQYSGQKGLWALETESLSIQQLNTTLQANIKLLQVQAPEIYYAGGKHCNESGIFSFNWESGEQKKLTDHHKAHINTLAYHPDSGLLFENCLQKNTTISAFKIQTGN